MKIEIELTDYQVKLLESDIVDIKDYMRGVLDNKIYHVERVLVLRHTDKNPDKISNDEKKNLLDSIVIEKAVDRNFTG